MYISEMGNVKHFQVVSSSPQWKKEGSSQTDLNWYLDFWRINGEAVNLAVMSERGIIVIYQWESKQNWQCIWQIA